MSKGDYYSIYEEYCDLSTQEFMHKTMELMGDVMRKRGAQLREHPSYVAIFQAHFLAALDTTPLPPRELFVRPVYPNAQRAGPRDQPERVFGMGTAAMEALDATMTQFLASTNDSIARSDCPTCAWEASCMPRT